MKRTALAVATALVFGSLAPASAHHGWRWAEDGNFELTGTVTEAKLGNPHGLLTLESLGQSWTVEVGQPWRNERAGLTDAMLQPGAELTVIGHRSSDPEAYVVKAERVVIGGETFNLYPDRD